EMPITPRETLRIVAPDNWMKMAPCFESTRSDNVLTAAMRDGPGTKRNPATMTDAMNLSMPTPPVAAMPSKIPPIGLSCGAIFVNAASRLLDARVQISNARSPMNGQLLTASKGGGIDRLPAMDFAESVLTLSASAM